MAYVLPMLALAALACTPTTTGGGGGGADGGGACVTSADCGSGSLCGFAAADGCGAKGRCFPSPGAVCQAYSPGCACDGSEITIVCTGLPNGYVAKPLAHAGSCADAGCQGAYLCLAPLTCATDADCASLGSGCDACTHFCRCGVPDAGACCPASWSMYACTYPDGGAGLACHNPALGCASSLTCGEGCDGVVVGRCAGP